MNYEKEIMELVEKATINDLVIYIDHTFAFLEEDEKKLLYHHIKRLLKK